MASTSDQAYDFLLKVILISNSEISRKQFLSMSTGNNIQGEARTTIGVNFAVKDFVLGIKTIKSQIWEVADKCRFLSLIPTYYHGAVGAVIALHMKKNIKYQDIHRSLTQLKRYGDKNMIGLVVAITRSGSNSTEEMQSFAEQNDLLFIETDSDMTNIDLVIKNFLTVIYRKITSR